MYIDSLYYSLYILEESLLLPPQKNRFLFSILLKGLLGSWVHLARPRALCDQQGRVLTPRIDPCWLCNLLVVAASSFQQLRWLVHTQVPLGTSLLWVGRLQRAWEERACWGVAPWVLQLLTLPVPSASWPFLRIEFISYLNHSFFLAIFILIPNLVAPVICSLWDEVMVTLVKGMVRIGFRDGTGGGGAWRWFISGSQMLIFWSLMGPKEFSFTGFKMRKIDRAFY